MNAADTAWRRPPRPPRPRFLAPSILPALTIFLTAILQISASNSLHEHENRNSDLAYACDLYIAPTSKISKKYERAAQIRSAKIIDKKVHDIIGSDVPWGKNRLVVKYTLSRLKSDIKSRVIRLSASPPVNTPTMGVRGGLCPSVRTPD